MKKLLLISLWLLLMLFMVAAVSFQLPDLTDLNAVLVWLATVGSPFLVGLALSLLIENWSGWGELPRFVKTIVPMAASVLIAIGATYALKYPDIIGQVAPWFTIAMGAILGWLGTQRGYVYMKSNEYGARFAAPATKKKK